MKKLLAVGLTLSLIFFAICCNKGSLLPTGNNGNNNNNNTGGGNNGSNAVPLVTPKGFPTGPSVSKYISPAGGSVTTADGKIELDIPSGALPSGDTITIMNTLNFAPGGVGDSYDFLPNGLKFSIPVTIKYHYSSADMNGSSPLLSRIAYQDSAGIWHGLRTSSTDTLNQVISVTTTHFTPYTIFEYVLLVPGAGGNVHDHQLMVTKSNDWEITQITVSEPVIRGGGAGSGSGSGVVANEDDDLLTAPGPIDASHIDSWSVNGIENGNSIYGKESPHGTSCTYTAPPQVPNSGNPVNLSVKLKNYTFSTSVTINGVTSVVTFNDLQLNDAVTIIPDDYKFDVSIQYNDPLVDGGGEFAFGAVDNADLTVEVKDATTVTVTVNSNGTTQMIPASQGNSECTSTYSSGEVMNIVSGTGTVFNVGPDQPAEVSITLNGSGVTVPLFTLSGTSCSGTVGGQAVIGSPPGGFGFLLKDSTQYPASQDPNITIVVKSIH
jgi:hypothetical protein